MTDMKFNLAKGTIQKVTAKIGQRRNLVRFAGAIMLFRRKYKEFTSNQRSFE